MKKLILGIALVLFSTSAFGTQYQCSVGRSNGQTTTGIITEVNGAVSFTTFDNKDRYTSGTLFELKGTSLLSKERYADNVAFCTNVLTTATVDNAGNKSFKFKNTANADSLVFYDCQEFEQPPAEDEDVVCDIPVPKPSVCPATEPKKLGDKVDGKGKKDPENKAKKPKNPLTDKKPKPKKPTPNNMCPT